MDRDKWNEMVGGKATVMDDLEHKLFQARLCIASMKSYAEQDPPGHYDHELMDIWHRDIAAARIALAALYQHFHGSA